MGRNPNIGKHSIVRNPRTFLFYRMNGVSVDIIRNMTIV